MLNLVRFFDHFVQVSQNSFVVLLSIQKCKMLSYWVQNWCFDFHNFDIYHLLRGIILLISLYWYHCILISLVIVNDSLFILFHIMVLYKLIWAEYYGANQDGISQKNGWRENAVGASGSRWCKRGHYTNLFLNRLECVDDYLKVSTIIFIPKDYSLNSLIKSYNYRASVYMVALVSSLT